ncbi:hypothetical protein DPEC_G00204680 [Dallia pectoralis]|uniref:Uncharacterized protein n=1 Tax=Dallia pectoralis TaxID=75939 RepID=A0ACC2G4A5_DALPE|nr:hypothetical protein DPEC_G00204680 [Dallia pectoralis]
MNTDKQIENEYGQTVNDNGTENNKEKAHRTGEQTEGEDAGQEELFKEQEMYGKELTVEVEGHYARECVGTEREEEEERDEEEGEYVDGVGEKEKEKVKVFEDITEDEVEEDEMEQAGGGVDRGEDEGDGVEMELARAERSNRGRGGEKKAEEKRTR